jgi:UDP-glucose 4-epimerase
MNILITGGVGFIGSHLAEEFIADGHKVTVLDNLSSGSLGSITNISNDKNFCFVEGSVLDKVAMDKLTQNCDVIFHLAAILGVRKTVENPIETIVSNIGGAEIVFELASKYKKRVFFVSTSELYGKNHSKPLAENFDIELGPNDKIRWAYASSKAVGEFLAMSYFYEKKLDITIVRLFSLIGPRQNADIGMVVPRFIKQAIANDPITVYGNGKQSRCFIFVKDVAKILVELSKRRDIAGETFNIGGEQEISIIDLARKIKEITESDSEINLVSYKKAFKWGFEDVKKRIPNLTKIKKIIRPYNLTPLDKALIETARYFKGKTV